MALRPEVSIGTGLATAVIVWTIHNEATPTIAEMRVSAPGDRDLNAARKQASWMAAAVVAGISLIAKDATVFVIGGAMVIALNWWERVANEVDPATGRVGIPRGPAVMDVLDPTAAQPQMAQ